MAKYENPNPRAFVYTQLFIDLERVEATCTEDIEGGGSNFHIYLTKREQPLVFSGRKKWIPDFLAALTMYRSGK